MNGGWCGLAVWSLTYTFACALGTLATEQRSENTAISHACTNVYMGVDVGWAGVHSRSVIGSIVAAMTPVMKNTQLMVIDIPSSAAFGVQNVCHGSLD